MFAKRRQKRDGLVDLLDEHAEILASGAGNEDDLLAQYPEDSDVLAELVALSRRLYDTLVPVEPSSAFVSNLKTAITDETNAQAGIAKRWRLRRIRLAQRSSVLGNPVYRLDRHDHRASRFAAAASCSGMIGPAWSGEWR
ncbi:MAG: hypothetical protein P8Z40_13590 [Chloroflexota bacterium]